MWSTPGVLAILVVSQALLAYGGSISVPLQRADISTSLSSKRNLNKRYMANGSGIEPASVSEDDQ